MFEEFYMSMVMTWKYGNVGGDDLRKLGKTFWKQSIWF